MKNINFNADDKTNNIEEQISSMLEKVLVDDDTDAFSATVITNTSQSTIFNRRGSNMSDGLFNFSRNSSSNLLKTNHMKGFARNQNKKPNTVSYSNNANYYFNLLQQRNNAYMMNMRLQTVDYNFCPGYIPNDIINLQLRLRMNSEENPSNLLLN
jgi:hypothetical protein